MQTSLPEARLAVIRLLPIYYVSYATNTDNLKQSKVSKREDTMLKIYYTHPVRHTTKTIVEQKTYHAEMRRNFGLVHG